MAKKKRNERRLRRQARQRARSIVMDVIEDIRDESGDLMDDLLELVIARLKEEFKDRPFLLILISIAEELVPLFLAEGVE